MRCVPLPMIGVTGARRASFANVGRMPPSFAKMKLGRKMTYGMPGRLHVLLHLPLRAEVGHEVLRLLGRPERAHEHEPADAGLARGGDEVARAVDHDPLERLRLPLADRDEVDDRVAAGDRGAEALRVGHVSLDELAAPGLEPLAAAAVADEAAHVVVGGAERVHDVAADEAAAAGDEDHVFASSAKFCQ